MIELHVWLEAAPMPAGRLSGDDDGAIGFTYLADYLDWPGAHAISLSLPLTEQPYDGARSRAFFQNLLPENDQLDFVLAEHGIERGDLIGILRHLGADLPGALSCLPLDAPPIKAPGMIERDYAPLDDTELVEIVRRLGQQLPLPGEVRDPSPVAGIQRKIALVEWNGRFALPRLGSGAPTTHILKVPATSFPREAFYEANAAHLANFVGLDVAMSRSAWIGDYEVLIATRFDRDVTLRGTVHRLHQEDFAQALGLPSRLKYERAATGSRAFTAQAIAGLLSRTAVPAEAVRSFLRTAFFNLAIGNTDNHAKNHALLYRSGEAPHLAPLYDLVPIRLSDHYTHLFAFAIGNARQAEELTGDDIVEFLRQFGLTGARAARFLAIEIVPMLAELAGSREVADDWGARFDRLLRAEATRVLDAIAPILG